MFMECDIMRSKKLFCVKIKETITLLTKWITHKYASMNASVKLVFRLEIGCITQAPKGAKVIV